MLFLCGDGVGIGGYGGGGDCGGVRGGGGESCIRPLRWKGQAPLVKRFLSDLLTDIFPLYF